MALKSDYVTQDCSIARALEVVGERWTPLILRDCFFGVRRFNDLQRHLGLPRAVLTSRLSTLVDAGVLERQEYQQGRDEYVLTDRGLELWPVLHSLSHWGEHIMERGPRRIFTHIACATQLDAHGRCTECGLIPDISDIEVRPGPGLSTEDPGEPVGRALLQPHRLLDPLPVNR
jgi:DNA-binding HxlR family transcriptional regulator